MRPLRGRTFSPIFHGFYPWLFESIPIRGFASGSDGRLCDPSGVERFLQFSMGFTHGYSNQSPSGDLRAVLTVAYATPPGSNAFSSFPWVLPMAIRINPHPGICERF